MNFFYHPFIFAIFIALILPACTPKTVKQNAQSYVPAITTAAPIQILNPKIKSPADETIDSWQLLISLFVISNEFNPRIEKELNWFLSHPEYIHKIQERAEPYLYNIIEEVKAKELPGEYALLPAIESGFRAHAYSHARAAGLWQFIPSTGRMFNLQQNWWYDGRRDVHASTKAATLYLDKLAARFDGDWLLALAAYNAGGGNVSRAIRRNDKLNKASDYWSLKLPKETTRYVPKLLALAKIFANADAYGIKLKKLEHTPYFSVVNIGSQLDLAKAAELSELELDELFLLNPGLNRGFTPPNGPHHLLIPVAKVPEFEKKLALLPASERVKWQRHKIKSGENLSVIAQHYKVKTSVLRSVNKIKNNQIRAGKYLYIPISKTANNINNPFVRQDISYASSRHPVYTVKSGDNLWSIARKLDLHSKDIARWNRIGLRTPLRIGQKLQIKQKTKVTKGLSRNRSAHLQSIHYTVRSGDSLSSISAKFNVRVNDLRRWNKRSLNKYLKPGQRLMVKVDTSKPST